MTVFSVSGKTAIVTGAGSGINLAFSELLLSLGCNVVLADLALRPEAQAVVSRYEGANNTARAVYVETDVTSWPALTNMFRVALAEFGDSDIVCPGAGVYEPQWSSFWLPPGSLQSRDPPDSGHYAQLDINLTHPIRVTQLAVSHWLHPAPSEPGSKWPTPQPASPASNPKRVVHLSSLAGQLPVFRAPMYGASKFAISGFVRCLAPLEAERGIRVTAVAPGLVRTPLWTENPDKLANIDQERDGWVTPEEVAEAMLKLLQDEEYVGGTVLEVGMNSTRIINAYNDPGPDMSPGKGLITGNASKGDDMVRGWLDDKSVWGPRN